jgi:hypothetical protein
MRLRTALPFIISASGTAFSNKRESGCSTGRFPYSLVKNSSSNSGARTFSHISTVETASPANVSRSGGTSRGTGVAQTATAEKIVRSNIDEKPVSVSIFIIVHSFLYYFSNIKSSTHGGIHPIALVVEYLHGRDVAVWI